MDEQEKPRGRGRPKGVKNKQKEPEVIIKIHTPPGFDPTADYRYADPMTLVARQMALIDWAQQAKRNEMQSGMQAKGYRLDNSDAKALMDISHALHRNLESLKKSTLLADEMAAKKTPEELLEIAVKKIEGQSRPTIIAIMKRLRLYLQNLGPIHGNDRLTIDGGQHGKRNYDNVRAADALNDLAKDLDGISTTDS